MRFPSPGHYATIGDLMPELPDVVVCIECLERRIVGQPLLRPRIANPALQGSASP